MALPLLTASEDWYVRRRLVQTTPANADIVGVLYSESKIAKIFKLPIEKCDLNDTNINRWGHFSHDRNILAESYQNRQPNSFDGFRYVSTTVIGILDSELVVNLDFFFN